MQLTVARNAMRFSEADKIFHEFRNEFTLLNSRTFSFQPKFNALTTHNRNGNQFTAATYKFIRIQSEQRKLLSSLSLILFVSILITNFPIITITKLRLYKVKHLFKSHHKQEFLLRPHT